MNLLKEIEDGTILSVYKPLTWTSFDVVNKIKSLTKKQIPKLKIGHAGTLDPLAEGLLIICTQRMTKQVEHIHTLPKTYIAHIFLGANRPSYDKETEISEMFPIKHIDKSIIEKTLSEFKGKQQQYPPVFSAVKQDGKPLYLKARKGIEVAIQPKEIEIYSIKLLDWTSPILKVELTVSKGTYIRSFAYDLGKKLQSGAYLDYLERTQIGEYHIDKAWKMEELDNTLKS